MVDSVHIRCHDKPAQDPVQFQWNIGVSVVEHGHPVEDDLERYHREGRGPQHHNRRELDGHGSNYLDRMEADACCQVVIEIRMVHHVEAPEGGNCVEHDVLKIDDEVEKDDGESNEQPIREVHDVEYSPAFFTGPESQLNRGDGKRRRKATELMTTMPRFANHRLTLDVVNVLRGTSISHRAMRTRVPTKKPRRMLVS